MGTLCITLMEQSYLSDLLWITALGGVRKSVRIHLNWMQLLFSGVKIPVRERLQQLCVMSACPQTVFCPRKMKTWSQCGFLKISINKNYWQAFWVLVITWFWEHPEFYASYCFPLQLSANKSVFKFKCPEGKCLSCIFMNRNCPDLFKGAFWTNSLVLFMYWHTSFCIKEVKIEDAFDSFMIQN